MLSILDLPSDPNALMSDGLRKALVSNVNKSRHYASHSRVKLLRATLVTALAEITEIEKENANKVAIAPISDPISALTDV